MFHRNLVRGSVLLLALVTGALLNVKPVQANDKVYARAVKSTVLIEVLPKTIGTGALIDTNQRLVVTANHVVAKAKEVNVYFAAFDSEGHVITNVKHYGDNSARLAIKGTVIARLERCDLALVQLASLPDGAVAMPLAPRSAEPGQRVHVLGNSSINRGAVFNYSGDGKVRNVVDLKLTITVVNVEGQPKEQFEGRVLESSVVVREGDSGGPVVNDAGELVGVVRGTIGAIAKDKEFSEPQVNIDPDVSEVKTMLKTAGFNVAAAAPPVVKAKPKQETPAPDETQPTTPKSQSIVGLWKRPITEPDGSKLTLQYQFGADGSLRITKVNAEGVSREAFKGQYELTDDKLTFKVDGKVRLQLQIQFVDANSVSVRKEGGTEALTWKR